MKICPACKTQYTDDTLLYCLSDGTPLTAGQSGDASTIVFDEAETVVSSRPEQGRAAEVLHGATHEPTTRGARTAVVVAVTAFVMLAVFGVAALIYLRGDRAEVSVNTTDRGGMAPPIVRQQPSPTVTKPQASPAANTAASSIEDPEITREVSRVLEDWKSQSESLDIDGFMSHYAATVDYYRKSGATAAFVRSDKERAFSRYDSITLDLSNIAVTTDASGQTATAVFDKEWEFEGDGNSSGKVRQMLRLRKIDGDWLITAEKDLKVFYTR